MNKKMLFIISFLISIILTIYLSISQYFKSQIISYAKFWNKYQVEDKNSLIYVALGDSSAQSIGASHPLKGYVGVFSDRLSKKEKRTIKIVNLGQSGATTEDVLNKQIPKLKNLNTSIVTLSVGTNDTYTKKSAEDIVENFKKITNSLPPNSLIAEIPYLMSGTKETKAKYINEKLKDLTSNNNLKLVSLYKKTKAVHFKWDSYAIDFFHPSDKAYQIWAEAFWNAYLNTN